jgi:hypothetical protein
LQETLWLVTIEISGGEKTSRLAGMPLVLLKWRCRDCLRRSQRLTN